jgi:DNA recombination-dependent growth factor C
MSFLPGIPPSTRLTYGYIDSQLGMLMLGATSEAADEFVTEFGKALGGAPPLVFLSIADDPCIHYTAWAKDVSILDGIADLGTQWTLKHPGTDNGCGIINLKHEEVCSDEMLALIEGGRQICAITLVTRGISLRLTSTLGLRNITLDDDDEVTSELHDQFARFVPVLRDALDTLGPLLGGWTKQEVLDLKEEGAA